MRAKHQQEWYDGGAPGSCDEEPVPDHLDGITGIGSIWVNEGIRTPGLQGHNLTL